MPDDGPDSSPTVAPLALAYDELPPGSNLRREYRGSHAVTITAPPGEPSEAARRAAAHTTGLFSALLCAGLLSLALHVGWRLFPSVGRLDRPLLLAAAILFGCFAGGVFLLVWKVQYGARLDLLSDLCREAVVMYADGRRLLVEIAGPHGGRSHEFTASDIRRFDIISGGWTRRRVPCLTIRRRNNRTFRILAGRHPAELRWVAATLSQVLQAEEF